MPRPLLLSLLAALACSAQAQPLPDTLGLEGVEVTAPRWHAAERTAQTLRLDARQIEQSGAQTLAGVLEAHTSAFARRYGPAGLATISLRGTGAGQTAVLLDGFPIANPQLGQVDGALVPAHAAGRVDVLMGAGSVWHGSQAVGGVVNVVPHAARGRLAGVRVEAGAWGERTLAVRAAARSVRVGVEHARGEGDFPYRLERAGEAVRLRRQGAAFERASVLATAQRGRTRGGLLVVTARRELPGPAGRAPQGERQDDLAAHAYARHTRALGSGVLQAGALLGHSDLRYRAPAADDLGATQTAYADLTYARPLDGGTLDGGLSLHHARAAHPSLSTDARETAAAAWAGATLTRGRLLAAPSLRFDGRTDGTAALTPRLGLALTAGGGLTLRASAARAWRAPTLNDRFWTPGGNADLRAERGWSAEAGARWAGRSFHVDATAYRHALRDQIVWLPSGGVWAPRNLARTQTLGLDLDAAWTPASSRWLRAGATLTDARDRTAGAHLRFVPLAQVRLHVGARLLGFDVDVLTRAVGRRPITSDESQWLPGHVTLDAGVRRAWTVAGARVSAFARLLNAADARYRLIAGYPMPGRHARAGLSLTLERE